MDKSQNNKVRGYIEFYKHNLENSVIPFWMEHSPDYDYGGTFSCLARNGEVYDTKKYVWLQGRSVWMFSRLYNEYEKNPQFLKVANLGLNFIDEYASDENGRFYFSLTRSGSPYSYRDDIFNMSFCMIAYLEYFRSVGDESYYKKSIELFENARQQIESAGSLNNNGKMIRISLLPNLMVLADMATQLYEFNKADYYLEVMADVSEKINLHYRTSEKIFMENVSPDGSDISEWCEGRFFCPGHSIEVAWFILEMLEYFPDESMQQKMFDVVESSLELGWDKEFGGIYNFLDIEGKPTLLLENDTKLWWPLTETIYALLLIYKKSGDEKWLKWLDAVHNYLLEHFLDKEYGGWFGFCDKYGDLINTSKGSHSKGFFHIPRTLLKSINLFSQAGGDR